MVGTLVSYLIHFLYPYIISLSICGPDNQGIVTASSYVCPFQVVGFPLHLLVLYLLGAASAVTLPHILLPLLVCMCVGGCSCCNAIYLLSLLQFQPEPSLYSLVLFINIRQDSKVFLFLLLLSLVLCFPPSPPHYLGSFPSVVYLFDSSNSPISISLLFLVFIGTSSYGFPPLFSDFSSFSSSIAYAIFCICISHFPHLLYLILLISSAFSGFLFFWELLLYPVLLHLLY